MSLHIGSHKVGRGLGTSQVQNVILGKRTNNKLFAQIKAESGKNAKDYGA